MKTLVIFRTFKEGDVIALFPEEPGTNDIRTCLSYQRVGQHGSADVAITRSTRPSTPKEICDLACELRGLGYDLKAARRFTRRHQNIRLEKIQRIK